MFFSNLDQKQSLDAPDFQPSVSPMALSAVTTIPTPPPTSYDIDADGQEHQNVQQKQRLWDWLRKLRRDEQTTPNNEHPTPDTPPQTPSRPAFGRRPSKKKVGVGIPRSTTFRRQQEEQRTNLEPVQNIKEKRDVSTVRQRALSAEPTPAPSKHPKRETSAPDLGYHHDAYLSIDGCIEAQDFAHTNFDEQDRIPVPPPPPPQPPSDAELDDDASQTSDNTTMTDDEQFRQELEKKWILNLSMHFRDKSPREKFFVTFAEQPQKWRRVTVSCDYRNAEADSLEADLQAMSSQREKSSRIYESLRGSLTDIQFYDTVTNLKLETRDERLHVHVTEDVNEIIAYPPKRSINHIEHIKRYKESDLHFLEHMSGFVYKVDVEGNTLIKKEIPGPDSVDEFLYEVNALSSLVSAQNVIRLQGLVTSEDGSVVKGLLIDYAEKNALVDIIYDNRGSLPWVRRERWAQQIIQGLSEIHEAGFVQGDFTLSNIVIGGNDEAKIIDINRRGCPVGWEPPEITALINGAQRISMFIGVKSDLFQLGMVLWGLAMEEDEPERQPRPLSLEKAPKEVPIYFRELVARCLDANPAMRMSGRDLLRQFPASVMLQEESTTSLPQLKPAHQQVAIPVVTGSTSRAEVKYPHRISTPDLKGPSEGPGDVTTSVSRARPKPADNMMNGAREYTGMLSQTAVAAERRYSKGDTEDFLRAPQNAEGASSNEPQAASSTPSRSAVGVSKNGSSTQLTSDARLGSEPVKPDTDQEPPSPYPIEPSKSIPISQTGDPNWEDLINGPNPYLIHRDTLDSLNADAPQPRRSIYRHHENGHFSHVDSGLADIEPDESTSARNSINGYRPRRRSLEENGRGFKHVDSGFEDSHLAYIGGHENLSFAERAHQRGLSREVGGVDLEGLLKGGEDISKLNISEDVIESIPRIGDGKEAGQMGEAKTVTKTEDEGGERLHTYEIDR